MRILSTHLTFTLAISIFITCDNGIASPISVTDFVKAKVSGDECVGFVRRNDSVSFNSTPPNIKTKSEKENEIESALFRGGDYPFNRDTNFIVRKGDIFTLSLQQALIYRFSDPSLLSKKTGEIAIVANVQERKSGLDYNFKAGSEQEGRVVFFQKNVQAGTPLNLANLPVYGPARYEGNPLMVNLYVVEIDAGENKVFSGIVDSLANLSRTIVPVNTAAMSVLNSLGNTLLKFNKNDIIAEYRVEFMPATNEHDAIKNVVLEYGNYAFSAKQDKLTEWHNWSGRYYNQKNSRLFSDKKCTDLPLKEETWMTFQVNKTDQEATLPRDNTLALLIASLEQEGENDAGKIMQLSNKIIENKNNNIEFEKYKKILAHLENNKGNHNNKDKAEIKKMINNAFDKNSHFDRIQKQRIVEDLSAIFNNPYISELDSAADLIKQLSLE